MRLNLRQRLAFVVASILFLLSVAFPPTIYVLPGWTEDAGHQWIFTYPHYKNQDAYFKVNTTRLAGQWCALGSATILALLLLRTRGAGVAVKAKGA